MSTSQTEAVPAQREFYRKFDFAASPFLAVGVLTKMQDRLARAKAGDRTAESSLCNFVGSVRLSVNDPKAIPADLLATMQAAVSWLRSVGRIVHLESPDSRLWISTRDKRIRE